MRGRPVAVLAVLAGLGLPTMPGFAMEPRPEVVADFARRVQPLLLNRCATGGCHGGHDAGGLRLVHQDFTGRISREITLGNIAAILAACGSPPSPANLAESAGGRHPRSATSPRDTARPLSPREWAVLKGWLTAALTTDAPSGSEPANTSRPPNRLRKLLDEAANPPPLPPPEEPRGLILR
jgi:hypothetical protein